MKSARSKISMVTHTSRMEVLKRMLFTLTACFVYTSRALTFRRCSHCQILQWHPNFVNRSVALNSKKKKKKKKSFMLHHYIDKRKTYQRHVSLPQGWAALIEGIEYQSSTSTIMDTRYLLDYKRGVAMKEDSS